MGLGRHNVQLSSVCKPAAAAAAAAGTRPVTAARPSAATSPSTLSTTSWTRCCVPPSARRGRSTTATASRLTQVCLGGFPRTQVNLWGGWGGGGGTCTHRAAVSLSCPPPALASLLPTFLHPPTHITHQSPTHLPSIHQSTARPRAPAGNINQLVLKLSTYCGELARHGGVIAEFVNPKYRDASRDAFKSSTRLECMMQARGLPRLQGHACKGLLCQPSQPLPCTNGAAALVH